jgi:hypothetical protein
MGCCFITPQARQHEYVERMIVSDKSIITLAHSRSNNNFALTSWSLVTGLMEWESLLPADEGADLKSVSGQATDLVYDGAAKRIHALAGNCVSVINVNARGATVGSPFCGSSQGDEGRVFRVAQLALPLSPVRNNKEKPQPASQRVAVGCMVPAGGEQVCAEIGYLEMQSSTRLVLTIVKDSHLPVHAHTLVSTLSQSGAVEASDVLAGIDVDFKAVHSLSFTGGASVVSRPIENPDTQHADLRLHLVTTSDDDIVPAITVCTKHSSHSCWVGTVDSRKSNAHEEALTLSHHCASDKHEDSAYAHVLVGTNQHAQFASLSTSLQCAVSNVQSTVVKQFVFGQQGAVAPTDFKIMHKQQHLFGQTGFSHVAFEPVASSQSGATTCRGLIVTRTGMTNCISNKQPSSSQNTVPVLWTRDEALANLHASVQFELSVSAHPTKAEAKAQSDEEDSADNSAVVGAFANEDFGTVPDFKTRLALQQVELKVITYVCSAYSSLVIAFLFLGNV